MNDGPEVVITDKLFHLTDTFTFHLARHPEKTTNKKVIIALRFTQANIETK